MERESTLARQASGGTPPGVQAMLVYVTASSVEAGERMARTLVEERLAACVNVVEGVTSFYWWEGEVQRDREVLLLVKTQAARLDRLVARVRELAGYEVPATSALPVVGGNPDYLHWVVQETSPREG